MDDSIERAREILRAQVEKLSTQLAELDRQRNQLQASLTTAQRGLQGLEGQARGSSAFVITGVHANQFRGKRLVQALMEYLESQGREVSLEELTEAMKQGNAHLGDVPGREQAVVKIAISTNRHLLTLKGNIVAKAAPGTAKQERKKRRK